MADTDNHVCDVIDAIFMRMSQQERYSDDDDVIAGHELKPLDVVTDNMGSFGVVHRVDAWLGGDGELCWYVCCVGSGSTIHHHESTTQLRTIDETEGMAARECLTAYFGGKQ